MKRPFQKFAWALMALVLVQAACGLTPPTPKPTDQDTPIQPYQASKTPIVPSPTSPRTYPPIPEVVSQPSFAQYAPQESRLPETFQGGYSLPVNLGRVEGMGKLELSDAQRSLLSQNGFVVLAPEPGKWREFYQVYESGRYYRMPTFITTDSVYHVYHLLFDKMLRDLERDYFIRDLESLTAALLETSADLYVSLRGTTLEEAALRNLAYFAVAARLLGIPDTIPNEAQAMVLAELNLIDTASGPALSPIWDRPDLAEDKKLIEDYSQYNPRGHYTRSEELARYFRAMMWYGRLTFRLMDTFETQRALLVAHTIRTAQAQDGTPALTLWQNIYDPTVFIVGKADDLGVYEYGALSDHIFGLPPDPVLFADQALLDQFMQASEALPPPQVNSMWVWIWQDQETVTKGFRFMGQRFTLDEYVFGQLIWRKVGTPDSPRGLPKGLDFFAAMDSQAATDILFDELNEDRYTNYESQMNKVRSEVAALGMDSWTQNLYWSWLYALQPLIQPKGSAYPAFMQTQAWAYKDLQTALSSWTELKHDTILYAKQVMAEMGGGGLETIPHSYVEPNPEAYARLLALAQMTYDGLDSRALLSDLTRANLSNLIEELSFLKDISERELAGEPISDEEYLHMLFWGGILEQFTLAAADTEGEGNRTNLEDQRAALVADVATGTNDLSTLVVLEEGVGQPTEIFVVLPDDPWRIAVGAVFTYYEFTVPPDQRMTDETWQEMVENGTNPPQPSWTRKFIAP